MRVLISGIQDAGYNHINLDDCYSEKQRSPAGDIVASALFRVWYRRRCDVVVDKARFPSGMQALTDQIHELGL